MGIFTRREKKLRLGKAQLENKPFLERSQYQRASISPRPQPFPCIGHHSPPHPSVVLLYLTDSSGRTISMGLVALGNHYLEAISRFLTILPDLALWHMLVGLYTLGKLTDLCDAEFSLAVAPVWLKPSDVPASGPPGGGGVVGRQCISGWNKKLSHWLIPRLHFYWLLHKFNWMVNTQKRMVLSPCP